MKKLVASVFILISYLNVLSQTNESVLSGINGYVSEYQLQAAGVYVVQTANGSFKVAN